MANPLSDTEFDCILLGSGLSECLIAGAVAMKDQKILLLDIGDGYGSSLCDYQLKRFIQFVETEKKLIDNPDRKVFLPFEFYEQECTFDSQFLIKHSREFLIELIPKVILARSLAVDCMCESGVNQYVEFQNMNPPTAFYNEQIIDIPLSKSQIFKTKELTLVEKRSLVKLIEISLSFYDQEYEEEEERDINSTHVYQMNLQPSSKDLLEIKEFEYLPAVNYLKKKKINQKLQDILFYSIIGANSSQASSSEELLSTSEFVKLLTEYLRSIAHYGDSPCLVPLYGASEFPQAFSRLGALFQGIYIVNNMFHIQDINLDADGAFESVKITYEELPVRGKSLVVANQYSNFFRKFTKKNELNEQVEKNIEGAKDLPTLLRMILILNYPLISEKRGFSTVGIPPLSKTFNNTQPMKIIQKDDYINSAAEGFYVYYFSTLSRNMEEKEENISTFRKIIANSESLFPLAKSYIQKKREEAQKSRIVHEERLIRKEKEAAERKLDNLEDTPNTQVPEGICSLEESKKEGDLPILNVEHPLENIQTPTELAKTPNVIEEEVKDQPLEWVGKMGYYCLYTQFMTKCPASYKNIYFTTHPTFDTNIDLHFRESMHIYTKLNPRNLKKEFLIRPEEYPVQDAYHSEEEEKGLVDDLENKLFKKEKNEDNGIIEESKENAIETEPKPVLEEEKSPKLEAENNTDSKQEQLT